jgi:hypothetical protein
MAPTTHIAAVPPSSSFRGRKNPDKNLEWSLMVIDAACTKHGQRTSLVPVPNNNSSTDTEASALETDPSMSRWFD